MAVGHCGVRQWLTVTRRSAPQLVVASFPFVSSVAFRYRQQTGAARPHVDSYGGGGVRRQASPPRSAACALQCLPLLTSAACSLEAIASETCKWMQPALPPPPSAATDAAPPALLLLGVVAVFRVSRQAFQRMTESLGDALHRVVPASRYLSYTSYSRCYRR